MWIGSGGAAGRDARPPARLPAPVFALHRRDPHRPPIVRRARPVRTRALRHTNISAYTRGAQARRDRALAGRARSSGASAAACSGCGIDFRCPHGNDRKPVRGAQLIADFTARLLQPALRLRVVLSGPPTRGSSVSSSRDSRDAARCRAVYRGRCRNRDCGPSLGRKRAVRKSSHGRPELRTRRPCLAAVGAVRDHLRVRAMRHAQRPPWSTHPAVPHMARGWHSLPRSSRSAYDSAGLRSRGDW